MTPIIHPEDEDKITQVQRPVFDRGSLVMVGTNVRVGDVVAKFIRGDTIALLASDFEVDIAIIEAALRTSMRSGKRDP